MTDGDQGIGDARQRTLDKLVPDAAIRVVPIMKSVHEAQTRCREPTGCAINQSVNIMTMDDLYPPAPDQSAQLEESQVVSMSGPETGNRYQIYAGTQHLVGDETWLLQIAGGGLKGIAADVFPEVRGNLLRAAYVQRGVDYQQSDSVMLRLGRGRDGRHLEIGLRYGGRTGVTDFTVCPAVAINRQPRLYSTTCIL